MRQNSLICVSRCLLLAGAMAGSGAFAQAPVHFNNQVTVTTHRSDGSIFSRVSQTNRAQKRRAVRISSSQQALPNRTVPAADGEYVVGGKFATATVGTPKLVDVRPVPVIIVPAPDFPKSPHFRPKR